MTRRLSKWMGGKLNFMTINRQKLKNFLGSERGAGAVEYGLIIAVIVVMVIGAATILRDPLEDFFQGALDLVRNTFGI